LLNGSPYAIRPLSVCLSVCPSVLSVTLVYCGQTVGLIKMKLGTQVRLGPGHTVLDGDPAPHPPKGHSPQFSAHICCGEVAGRIKMPLGTEVGLGPGDFVFDGDPAPPLQKGRSRAIFGPCILWPNNCMDHDGTWHGGGPGFKPYCARWGPSSPPPKGAEPPRFGPLILWANGWMHQDATWYGGTPRPMPHCARWGPSPPPSPKKGAGHNRPIFGLCLLWPNG